MVNQNPLLFNTSIGENIAYGAPDREVSEKGEFSKHYQVTTKLLPEIIKAAKLANAHDFITSFRGGYDTLAGSLGTQVDWTFSPGSDHCPTVVFYLELLPAVRWSKTKACHRSSSNPQSKDPCPGRSNFLPRCRERKGGKFSKTS